jgi:hypothetical protein
LPKIVTSRKKTTMRTSLTIHAASIVIVIL